MSVLYNCLIHNLIFQLWISKIIDNYCTVKCTLNNYFKKKKQQTKLCVFLQIFLYICDRPSNTNLPTAIILFCNVIFVPEHKKQNDTNIFTLPKLRI